MAEFKAEYESVAVSSRIRLARNLRDYPFPGRLMADPHAKEQASEIIRLIAAELTSMGDFTLYSLSETPPEVISDLAEKKLISRDLIRNRAISAVLVSREEKIASPRDERISVMINEEDHVREQYFIKGYDLLRAYERISGIDDIISDSVPFSYDSKLGYLTACPSNVGTGLRASVMLFLPALSRRGKLRGVASMLNRLGLTMRGADGEGSGAEGELFQISNEVTLGLPEQELLSAVEQAVGVLVKHELLERSRMKAEENAALIDRIGRSFGILTHCALLDEKELARRIADLKLGIALGYFGPGPEPDDRMEELDGMLSRLSPAGVARLAGSESKEEQDAFRAAYVSRTLAGMTFIP